MPFNADGTFTMVNGATNAFPGEIIASATWNSIFTDIQTALSRLGPATFADPTVQTGAGPFNITTEGLLVLNKATASATTVQLPDTTVRHSVPLRIIDWKGNAGDITILPTGTDTIEGLASWTLGSGGAPGTGGSITLLPSTALSGWLVMA